MLINLIAFAFFLNCSSQDPLLVENSYDDFLNGSVRDSDAVSNFWTVKGTTGGDAYCWEDTTSFPESLGTRAGGGDGYSAGIVSDVRPELDFLSPDKKLKIYVNDFRFATWGSNGGDISNMTFECILGSDDCGVPSAYKDSLSVMVNGNTPSRFLIRQEKGNSGNNTIYAGYVDFVVKHMVITADDSTICVDLFGADNCRTNFSCSHTQSITNWGANGSSIALCTTIDDSEGGTVVARTLINSVAVISDPVEPYHADTLSPEAVELWEYLSGLKDRTNKKTVIGQSIFVAGMDYMRMDAYDRYADDFTPFETACGDGEMPGYLEMTIRADYPMGSWDNNEAAVNDITTITNIMFNYYKAGGIVGFHFHHMNPFYDYPAYYEQTPADKTLYDLTNSATTEYAIFTERLDYWASIFQLFEDAHIPIIIRPFYELNANSDVHFWWGNRDVGERIGGEEFVKFYRWTHDYLTKTKGLTNLLFALEYNVYNSDDNSLDPYYVGDGYCDILSTQLKGKLYFDGSDNDGGDYGEKILDWYRFKDSHCKVSACLEYSVQDSGSTWVPGRDCLQAFTNLMEQWSDCAIICAWQDQFGKQWVSNDNWVAMMDHYQSASLNDTGEFLDPPNGERIIYQDNFDDITPVSPTTNKMWDPHNPYWSAVVGGTGYIQEWVGSHRLAMSATNNTDTFAGEYLYTANESDYEKYDFFEKKIIIELDDVNKLNHQAGWSGPSSIRIQAGNNISYNNTLDVFNLTLLDNTRVQFSVKKNAIGNETESATILESHLLSGLNMSSFDVRIELDSTTYKITFDDGATRLSWDGLHGVTASDWDGPGAAVNIMTFKTGYSQSDLSFGRFSVKELVQ